MPSESFLVPGRVLIFGKALADHGERRLMADKSTAKNHFPHPTPQGRGARCVNCGNALSAPLMTDDFFCTPKKITHKRGPKAGYPYFPFIAPSLSRSSSSSNHFPATPPRSSCSIQFQRRHRLPTVLARGSWLCMHAFKVATPRSFRVAVRKSATLPCARARFPTCRSSAACQ